MHGDVLVAHLRIVRMRMLSSLTLLVGHFVVDLEEQQGRWLVWLRRTNGAAMPLEVLGAISLFLLRSRLMAFLGTMFCLSAQGGYGGSNTSHRHHTNPCPRGVSSGCVLLQLHADWCTIVLGISLRSTSWCQPRARKPAGATAHAAGRTHRLDKPLDGGSVHFGAWIAQPGQTGAGRALT